MSNSMTVFSDISNFEVSQRMAKALTSSTLVPAHFQGEQNMGNALIGLEMAQRMGMSPLAVFQSLYVVHGRPAFSAAFIIACFNASGRFTPIQYEQVGEQGKDSFGFRAISAIRATGEKIEGPAVTMAIAKADGWTRNDKYKSMPELMLRYRAATWLVRQTAPEMTMGLHTLEEEQDVAVAERDVTPTAAVATIMEQARTQTAAAVVAAVAEPEPQVLAPTPKPTPEPVPEPQAEETPHEPQGPAHTWPERRDGAWYDVRGVAFHPDFHGFSRGEEAPAVSAQGAFRRKRGHDAAKLAEYEAEQLNPAPVQDDLEPEEHETEATPMKMDKAWFLKMIEETAAPEDFDDVEAVLTSCSPALGDVDVGEIENAIAARKDAVGAPPF